MRRTKATLGILTAVLVAGAGSAAFAEGLKAKPYGLEANEGSLQEELFLHIDPAWLTFDLNKEAAWANKPATLGSASGAANLFTQQETQSAIARAIKSGYSVGIEPEHLPAEMNRGYAVSEKFKASVRAGFDAPVGDEMRMTAAGAEARYSLGQLAPAISWGWSTGMDMSVQAGRGTHAIESGPQFKVGDDRLALTLSPKIAHNFGGQHENGDVAFAYAAGLKGELAKGVSLGIEAFGGTSDIASVPGTALQAHRSGPGLYVGLGLLPTQMPELNGSKLSLEIGALTGMNETNSDWAGKFKAAVTW